MAPMHLPFEMRDRIVDELVAGHWDQGHACLYGDSREDLEALSLVSKDWRLPAQRLLFASRRVEGWRQDLHTFIQYWGPFRCKSLSLSLDKEARIAQEDAIALWQHELAKRMRDLQCFRLLSCDTRIFKDVAFLLQQAVNLRSLSYASQSYLNIHGEPWDSATHFYYGNLHGVLPLLSEMQHLEYLFLELVVLQTATPTGPTPAMSSLSTSLRTITLRNCVLGDADLSALISPQSRITSLTIIDLIGPSQSCFSTALASVATQLESLCLVFPTGNMHHQRDFAVQQGLITADQRALSNYAAPVRQILPSCVNLRKLGLHKAGVAAVDLQNLKMLSKLYIDVPDGLRLPSSPISMTGLTEGTWLPSLQALILELPDTSVWSAQDSEWARTALAKRGATYTEHGAGYTTMTGLFIEGEAPDATRVLMQ